MSTYYLKYYAEIMNFRGQQTRVEIHQRDTAPASVLQIGDVCGLELEIQGGQDDIFVPIVKTQARLSMVASLDKPTSGGIKYGDWGEFYTPDATLYKFVIMTKQSESVAHWWKTRWTGYITPDSWEEGLAYRDAITITARDNIGHLQDFEFDMEGDEFGLASIESIINRAMEVVEMPMYFVDTQAVPTLTADDGTKILGAKVVVDTFRGKDWYSVLEGILDSIGYSIRFTDDNKLTYAPIRHLPLLGAPDAIWRPATQNVEFYGGSGTIVPAVKKITETHDYEYNGDILAPITNNKTYGSTQTYDQRKYNPGIVDNYIQAPYNKVTDHGDSAWMDNSDMLDPSLYEPHLLEDGWDQHAFIPINARNASLQQNLLFRTKSPDVTIHISFNPHTVTAFPVALPPYSRSLWESQDTLYKIKCAIYYSTTGGYRYWDGKVWVGNPVVLEFEYDATQKESATDLEVVLAKCDALPEEGNIVIELRDLQYYWQRKNAPTGGTGRPIDDIGTFTRIASIVFSVNQNNLTKNTVTTVNDEKNNISLNRNSLVSPLSKEVSFIVPANYGSALFYGGSGGRMPDPYPYMLKWSRYSGNTRKPLPVFIHQQILCYRGASLWELNGDCAPRNNELLRFNSLLQYKNRTYMLKSGTMDFMTGTINGASLREFLEYDDIWDDTQEGDWSDSSEYSGGGSTPSGGRASGGSSYRGGTIRAPGGGSTSLTQVWESLEGASGDYGARRINEAHLPESLVNAIGRIGNGDSFHGPDLTIIKGYANSGTPSAMAPVLRIRHPLLQREPTAEAVLMIYSGKRGRKLAAGKRKNKKGWGEALSRGDEFVVSLSNRQDADMRVLLDDIREFILQNYVCMYNRSQAQVAAMSYQTFSAADMHKNYPARFGALHSYTEPGADPDDIRGSTLFYPNTKASRRFGIAIRYENPLFTKYKDEGTPSDYTRQIRISGGHVDRYLYTDVTPFTAHVGGGNADNGNVIGFEIDE